MTRMIRCEGTLPHASRGGDCDVSAGRADGAASARAMTEADSAAPAPAPLLASAEGRLLAVGLALATLLLAAFGIGWLLAPEATLVLAAMTGLNLLIGRAAGLSFGYASGLDHPTVILGNLLVETIQVLVVYPLFALSWNHLLDLPRLRPWLARLRRGAETRQPWVQRFGIVGLFIFVFVPFWMTGPVVGAIIGFLIGLKPRVNVPVVLSATAVAIVLWALLLNELQDHAAQVHRYALVLAAVAVALLALVVRRLIRRS